MTECKEQFGCGRIIRWKREREKKKASEVVEKDKDKPEKRSFCMQLRRGRNEKFLLAVEMETVLYVTVFVLLYYRKANLVRIRQNNLMDCPFRINIATVKVHRDCFPH